ncbi:helix-turn-helix domain-containing protein [Nocardia wallacei]|uniref:helix-turn-helix domain-containing protein n=1 Tax=Nocardia wallacei TaxID=480035 RepID=UPI002458E8E0|nr:Scr1 family TA system antitoxin-like transcriptional regulator [Nocardia wallacei]
MDAPDDWKRLAEYIVTRRESLGMDSRRALADVTALSYRLLGDLERGVRQSVSEGTLALLEQGLAWEPGSAKAILGGGEPTLKGAPPQDGGECNPTAWMRALSDAYRVATELATAGQVDHAGRLTRALADISQSLIAYSSLTDTPPAYEFEPIRSVSPGESSVRSDRAHGERPAPTVLRIALGRYMRQLREQRNLTRERAGKLLGCSSLDIRMLELGQVAFGKEEITRLLRLYKVDDPRTIRECTRLATESSNSGWWTRYDDILPSWFRKYLHLEQTATAIRTYEAQFIPGLLQTEDYARAIIGVAGDSVETERRVHLRMERQRVLEMPRPPHLWAMIDEMALLRSPVTTAVMRDQIAHLVEMNDRPNIVIQIVPVRKNVQVHDSSFSMLRFRDPIHPDIVYIEQLTSAFYIDRRRDVDKYAALLDKLSVSAHSPDKSTKALQLLQDEVNVYAITDADSSYPTRVHLHVG